MLPWLAQQKHATKVGLLAYSVAQSSDCATGVKNSFDKYGAAAGAKVVFEDKSLAFGTADLSVQVSQDEGRPGSTWWPPAWTPTAWSRWPRR